MGVTDALAIALLKAVRQYGPMVLDNPEDYYLRSQIMWAGSLAHNDLTGCGTIGDWATHNMEHELSALYGVAHGAGLASLWCHWANYVMDAKVARFARFAREVFDVDAIDDEVAAREGVNRMRAFYHSIGMPASIPALIGRKATEEELLLMAEKCSRGKTITNGNFKQLAYEDVLSIYRAANE
jgi:alcohol dehydrogenase YqhD (iron-dependent ADH family)